MLDYEGFPWQSSLCRNQGVRWYKLYLCFGDQLRSPERRKCWGPAMLLGCVGMVPQGPPFHIHTQGGLHAEIKLIILLLCLVHIQSSYSSRFLFFWLPFSTSSKHRVFRLSSTHQEAHTSFLTSRLSHWVPHD